jgi:hypothetical protein
VQLLAPRHFFPFTSTQTGAAAAVHMKFQE